jgi:hypothetical protein
MILIDSLLHISFRISHPGALYDGCVESYRKNKLDIQTKSARYPAARVTPRITLITQRSPALRLRYVVYINDHFLILLATLQGDPAEVVDTITSFVVGLSRRKEAVRCPL